MSEPTSIVDGLNPAQLDAVTHEGGPLLVVVAKDGASPGKEDVLGFLADKVAKWWLPDDVVFVEELPHTATGKISKARLRERFKDYELPTA